MFILIQIAVPSDVTTYWCTAFKLSDFIPMNSTKHIIEVCLLASVCTRRPTLKFTKLLHCRDKGTVHGKDKGIVIKVVARNTRTKIIHRRDRSLILAGEGMEDVPKY